MEVESPAPGHPGIAPRWTSSAKDGVGTAYNTSSRLWFTLSHGIVNEVYFPSVDMPNTRDFQFLITDGETFCHEERRDLDHLIEYPEPGVLFYRLTNTDPQGRYRIVKEILAEPHSEVLLQQTRLEILDVRYSGKLKLFALLSPHLRGTGYGNSARKLDAAGRKLMHAEHGNFHLVLGCAPDFSRRSVGYAGRSDGWRDLMETFALAREYGSAAKGNVSMIGEIDLSAGTEFILGIGFGHSCQSATAKLLQALASPFPDLRKRYVDQWRRAGKGSVAPPLPKIDLATISQAVLLAHEDKEFPGAFVASLSIPWGETKDDLDRGGYHLVWTRDMVQTATALLACGHEETPLRALIWLSCVQGLDGGLPQNSSIAGEPYWKGQQLDEVAMPILLAWRVHQAGALKQFDPWILISRASAYLILHGPVTGQERWEENSGYSPSTLAAIIAALAVAAGFSRARRDDMTGDFLLAYADWLSSHLEDWMVTKAGELVQGIPRHYIRITPAPDYSKGEAMPNPDSALITIANGGGTHPARNVVSPDFLQLVRLGVRDAQDPLIVDSLKVVDEVLARDLPQGRFWRRYNHDGYGQKPDGHAYDGTGEGRSWPLLTGERGHYELEAGKDPLPFLETLEKSANGGGMLPEQIWDAEPSAFGKYRPGMPTGSAMPLCWAHAEYLLLLRSRKDGVVFDRIEPAYARYASNRPESALEIWTSAHPTKRMPRGKTLRIIAKDAFELAWRLKDGADRDGMDSRSCGLGLFWIDLPADAYSGSDRIQFKLSGKGQAETGSDWHSVQLD